MVFVLKRDAMDKKWKSTMSTHLSALHHLLRPSPLLELLAPLRPNCPYKVCCFPYACSLNTPTRPVSHIFKKGRVKKKTFQNSTVDFSFFPLSIFSRSPNYPSSPHFFRFHHVANACELRNTAASRSRFDDLSFLSDSSHKSGHIQSWSFCLVHVFCFCVLWVSGILSEKFESFKPGQRKSLCFRLLLGCCLIPFFVNSFKDAYHTCPRCRRVLHIHRKTCCK